MAKEVHILEKEVEELKAANVRLIGHANSRQKIQLHRKLKVRGGPSSIRFVYDSSFWSWVKETDSVLQIGI